jgi:hypothetical protein
LEREAQEASGKIIRRRRAHGDEGGEGEVEGEREEKGRTNTRTMNR